MAGMYGETPDEAHGIVVEAQSDLATIPRDRGEMESGGNVLAMLVRESREIERNTPQLIAKAKQIGGLLEKSGFYAFPVGGGTVQGPSIKMAQALAQLWKGIAYEVRVIGIEHLASGGKRVHLRATVTDLHAIVACSIDQQATTLAPPGKFGKDEEQKERWHSMQIQSAASKVVRNAILRILPAWFVSAGMQAAQEAASKRATGGKPLSEAKAETLAVYAEKFGLTKPELEGIVGEVFELWAVPQLSEFYDLYDALVSGETSVERIRANLREQTAAKTAPASGSKSSLGIKSKAETVDAKPTESAKTDTAPDAATAKEQEAFEKSQRSKTTADKPQAGLNLSTPKGGAKT